MSCNQFWLKRGSCQTEQVIEGLDRAVKTMKKGEVALLTIEPEYAFGPSESQQELAKVPANSTVYYEIELVSFVKVSLIYLSLFLFYSFEAWYYNQNRCFGYRNSNWMQEKESWDMNTEEKIEAAGKKKEEGNALFKAGKYERASKRYEKVT